MILKPSAMCLQCSTEASLICTHPLHPPPLNTEQQWISFQIWSLWHTRRLRFTGNCGVWFFYVHLYPTQLCFHFFFSFFFFFKGVELLVCDLLLTLRTSLWQRGSSSNGEPGPAPGSQLAGFQRDLSALRKLTQCYRQGQHKVGLWED